MSTCQPLLLLASGNSYDAQPLTINAVRQSTCANQNRPKLGRGFAVLYIYLMDIAVYIIDPNKALYDKWSSKDIKLVWSRGISQIRRTAFRYDPSGHKVIPVTRDAQQYIVNNILYWFALTIQYIVLAHLTIPIYLGNEYCNVLPLSHKKDPTDNFT